MRGRLEIVIAVVAIAYLGFILALVRRRQLREKYALLWLAVAAATIVASIARGPLDRLAVALGFSYGPSALFLFSTLFLMAVVAHLSWEVSRLEEKTRRLAEEIALSRPQEPLGSAPAGLAQEIDLSAVGAEEEPVAHPEPEKPTGGR